MIIYHSICSCSHNFRDSILGPELRDDPAKWSDYLDQLVRCSVCLQRPEVRVVLCVKGHHMCKSCRDMCVDHGFDFCPICKDCAFTEVINFVVEDLALYVDNIRLALLREPERIYLNVVKMTGERSTSTQIDNEGLQPPIDNTMIGQGSRYMRICQIGFCQSQVSTERMYEHVRENHERRAIADVSGVSGNHAGWEIMLEDLVPEVHDFEKIYNYALHAKGFGLFFINMQIDSDGHLFVNLQVANSNQDEDLYYEMLLYLPCDCYPIDDSGMVIYQVLIFDRCTFKTAPFYLKEE